MKTNEARAQEWQVMAQEACPEAEEQILSMAKTLEKSRGEKKVIHLY